MGNIKDYVIYIIAILIIGCLGVQIHVLNKRNRDRLAEIEVYNAQERAYQIQFYDDALKSLKNENKSLYDSLKMYKDELEYVAQFKYKKEYHYDTVYIEKIIKETEEEKVFSYSNEKNDSLNYNLTIGATKEPNWYKLDIIVEDQFTLVNKRSASGLNETTIQTKTDSQIQDVTVWKKNRSNFWDNFSVGPTVTVGYDMLHDKPALVVGVGATWNIIPRKQN